MRRPWWTRVLSAFLAAWFVILVTEPAVAMHQCPVHDGVLATSPMHGGAGGHGAPDGAMLSPMPGMTHGGHGSSPHDLAHHQCTCIGDCAGIATTALHAPRITAPHEPPALAWTNAAVPDDAVLPAAAEHVLPFANAPPRLI